MVKKIILIVSVILGVGVGTWMLYSILNVTDEELIMEQLESFQENASKRRGEKTTGGLIKAKSLENLIAPECSLDVDSHMFEGVYTPRQVSAMAMRCRTMVDYAIVDFADIIINVTSPDTATAEFSINVSGRSKKGNTFDHERDLVAELQKLDGKWVFTSFSIRAVIEQ